jgi:hypothetical protein|tara:strand:- start:221 stop:658 length:438 start_codon:yes stop_codon:yes gene_type:complete
LLREQAQAQEEKEKGDSGLFTGSNSNGSGETGDKHIFTIPEQLRIYKDYSSSSLHTLTNLGPLLMDSVIEKAKQRKPRVIAIGDVHGCIDELQMLLRKCDYSPGDLVVFLGDLVSKGPDSLSVVQLAREIGAIGVRGNHDFEVVR